MQLSSGAAKGPTRAFVIYGSEGTLQLEIGQGTPDQSSGTLQIALKAEGKWKNLFIFLFSVGQTFIYVLCGFLLDVHVWLHVPWYCPVSTRYSLYFCVVTMISVLHISTLFLDKYSSSVGDNPSARVNFLIGKRVLPYARDI